MASPPVHEEDNRAGALKNGFIFWPAIQHELNVEVRYSLKTFSHQLNARIELVHSWWMRGLSCYQDDFGFLCINYVFVESNAKRDGNEEQD
jgi:hypothetical protein